MSMNYLDLLPDDYIAEYREEGKDGRHGGFAVDDQKRTMIDLEAIGKIVNTLSSFVGMCHNDNFVSSIDQFLDVH